MAPFDLRIRMALDVLARLRATQQPLDGLIEDISRLHHLGPRERRMVGDLCFAAVRRRRPIEQLLERSAVAFGGMRPTRAEQDVAWLALAIIHSGIDVVMTSDQLAAAFREPFEQAQQGEWTIAEQDAWPPWLAAELRDHHSDGQALLAALQLPAPLHISIDGRALSRDAVLAQCVAAGIAAQPGKWSLSAITLPARTSLTKLRQLVGADESTLWPMDEGSQWLAHIAGSMMTGHRVLDLCAGGAGKSRVLCALGKDVTSVDVDDRRMRDVPTTAKRVVADGRTVSAKSVGAPFDMVLVDAPCSGTGTLRRSPDLAWRVQPTDIAALATLQQALLKNALELVRPGGRVLYATCSLLPQESRDVVMAVLATMPQASIVPVASYAADVAGSGNDPHVVTLRPDRHNTDGFMAAMIEVAP